MKCPKCGRENVNGAPFCADCGKALGGLVSETPKAEVPKAETPKVEKAEAAKASDDVPFIPVVTDGAVVIAPSTEPVAAPEPAAVEVESVAVEAEPQQAAVEMTAVEVTAEPAPAAVPDSVAAALAKPVEEPSAADVPDPEPAEAFEQAFDAPSSQEEVAQDIAVSEAEAMPAPEGAPVVEAAPAAAPQGEPVAAPAPEFVNGNTATVPPNPARSHQTYPQPGGEVLYKKGCLAAAWDDIVQSKNWLGKLLLLGLIGCVPILNFYVYGYAMRWSRQLFLGRVEEMPQRVLGNRMFVNGFFAFVIELVLSVVVSLCALILGLIPFLGGICAMVLGVFVFAFQCVATMRVAVADRLGAGFDIGQVWDACKRKFGALCCATILPYLIVTAVISVVAVAICMIFGLPIVINMLELAATVNSSYYYSDYQVAQAILSTFAMMVPLLLVCYVLGCFANALIIVLSMRATGHYVARYAQDWKNEAAVMSTAHINGD
ncbi:MAG: DUF4013 domain-containing protein [Eggerthellaceae bacterium]|nr:DUF4013 domain-containing protein [Eggerthellaceae bacterium]